MVEAKHAGPRFPQPDQPIVPHVEFKIIIPPVPGWGGPGTKDREASHDVSLVSVRLPAAPHQAEHRDTPGEVIISKGRTSDVITPLRRPIGPNPKVEPLGHDYFVRLNELLAHDKPLSPPVGREALIETANALEAAAGHLRMFIDQGELATYKDDGPPR